jgi:transcriptional regulator with XRE-family HTH domain
MSPPGPGRNRGWAQLHRASGLTYEQLAERTHLSRGTVTNYLTKPAHRRGTRELQLLVDALDAPAADRVRVLKLHRQTLPAGIDSADVEWRARARAAGCTVWSMAEFTADQATVHTAIGRRIGLAGQHAERPGEVVLPAYVPGTLCATRSAAAAASSVRTTSKR